MRIIVTFIPSDYVARYGYASYGEGGKVLIRGIQFDPFEELADSNQ